METSRLTLRTFPGEYIVVKRFPQGWYQVQRDDIPGGAYYHVREEHIERWLCGGPDSTPIQDASAGPPRPPVCAQDADVPRDRHEDEDSFEDEEDGGYEAEEEHTEEHADEDDSGTAEEASEGCLATAEECLARRTPSWREVSEATERALRATRTDGTESGGSQEMPSTPSGGQDPPMQAAPDPAFDSFVEEASIIASRLRTLDARIRDAFEIHDAAPNPDTGTFPGCDFCDLSVYGRWNGLSVQVLKVAASGKALCRHFGDPGVVLHMVLPLSEIRDE